MKFRTTLIAALLLAVFGAYVYFFEYKKAEEEKKKEEEEKKVFSLDWEKLRGLTITNAHGTFVVEKVVKEAEEGEAASTKADEWRIVEPLKADAENSAINGLVNNLKGAKVEQVVTESAEDLEPFGLKEPEIKVVVRVAEGEQSPAPLLLGGKSPIGHNSYAMVEGQDKVLLLGTHLVPQFDKDLYELRHKKLFAFKREDVERLRILRVEEPEVELVRQGEKWQLIRPFRARAAQTEVDKILNKLTTLKAESFHEEEPEDLAAYGLDKPVWKVEVVLKPDQTKATLLVGSIYEAGGKGYLYAKRAERPVVVSLGMDVIGTFSTGPEALREKKVIPLKTWEIKKAVLTWKGQDVTLVKREGGKWWIEDPIEARADGTKMAAFLSALNRLEGEEFLERPEDEEALAEYGLAEPLARVVLYKEKPETDQEEGEEEREETGYALFGNLLIGKGKGEEAHYYATAEGDETLYRVKGSFYEDDFPETMNELRSKKVLDVSRFLVAGIEYKGPEGLVVLEREQGVWKVKKPSSAAADEKDVTGLLTEAIGLEVERFVNEAPEDLAAWGLDPASGEIVLTQEGGEELGGVLFSDRGPEGEEGLLYVRSMGEPWVGLMQEAKKKALLDKLAGFKPED
jgi:hypothetical protein